MVSKQVVQACLDQLSGSSEEERMKVADELAEKIGNDKTFFSKDRDRESVKSFFAARLRAVLPLLSEERFQQCKKDHNRAGVFIIKLIEAGKII